ncbi:MAG: DUF3137 domain-containing protein [Clostridiales bacterium]|nr:DUF3137 domain-containing protein [Clostridiales bacterium]
MAFLILVIVVVVGLGKLLPSILMLYVTNRRVEAAPVEAMQAIPDDPGLTEEEITKKLRFLKKVGLINKISAPVFIIGTFAYFTMYIGESMLLGEFFLKFLLPVGAAFVLMLVVGVRTGRQMMELKSLMAASVTLPVLREIFEVKAYHPHGNIGADIIRPAGLIHSWESISGSDYFEGSYKGLNVLYSDLYLSHQETSTDSNGKATTTTVTDFLGQWLVCDFGKELASTVRLVEKRGGTTFGLSKSDIETENVDFNKKFRIIAEDGHTAFYLLTPHFMERLVEADSRANSPSLFCFQGGKVHIALYSGRDSFELGKINPNNMEAVRQKFRNDIKYMTDIMDTLLLNDKLFQDTASGRT